MCDVKKEEEEAKEVTRQFLSNLLTARKRCVTGASPFVPRLVEQLVRDRSLAKAVVKIPDKGRFVKAAMMEAAECVFYVVK